MRRTLTAHSLSDLSTSLAPARLSPFPTAIFAIALFAVCSRGLFELLVGKTAAYGLQLAAVGALTLVLLVRGQPKPNRLFSVALALLWLTIVAILLSIFFSYDSAGVQNAATYSAVMAILATAVFIYSAIAFRFGSARGVSLSISAVILAMVVTAFLQQFAGLDTFPGTDLGTLRTEARPSAMTGSFLHYPITLALLSLTLLGLAPRARSMQTLVGTLGLVAVILSYSRSGMVIVLAGLFFALVLDRQLKVMVRLIAAVPAILAIALVTLPEAAYFDRFLSIFDANGAGNAGRIDAWFTLISLWTESPLVVGSHAGEYTNITSNLTTSGALASPESGVLQILISLGVFGLVGYYGLMFIAVRSASRRPVWFRAALLGGIVQTLVYQSVEVFPFMVVFALVPLVSNLPRDKREGLSRFTAASR